LVINICDICRKIKKISPQISQIDAEKGNKKKNKSANPDIIGTGKKDKK